MVLNATVFRPCPQIWITNKEAARCKKKPAQRKLHKHSLTYVSSRMRGPERTKEQVGEYGTNASRVQLQLLTRQCLPYEVRQTETDTYPANTTDSKQD